MYSIKINTDRGELELRYSDYRNFRKYIVHQILHLYGLSDQAFHVELSATMQRTWDRKVKLDLFKFDKSVSVLDIGSGAGLLDLFLSKYLNNDSKFYLVDESKFTPVATQFQSTDSFYNNWNVFEDLVKSSSMDRSNFTLLSTMDEWPEELDLIMSNHSYMFHYPKELYWDRIIKRVRANKCRLAFDVLNLKGRDIVEEITSETGLDCKIIERMFGPDVAWKDELHIVDGYYARSCSWS